MDTNEFVGTLEEILYNGFSHDIVIGPIRKIASDNESRPSTTDRAKISYIRGSGRMQLSVRRYLTRVLHLNEPDQLSDQQLDTLADQISDKIKPVDEKSHTFSMLTGSDINDAYRTSVGGSSCMTGVNADYVGLYCDNPKKIKLAVVRYNNSSARCVVWIADDGKTYSDRIYSDYAKANRILSEQLSDLGIKDIYESRAYRVKVSDLNYTDGEVPYMDSMIFGEISDCGKLIVSNYTGSIDLQRTDGGIERPLLCCNCNDISDDVHHDGDDVWCEDCWYENFTTCEQCGSSYNVNGTEFICITIGEYKQYICEHCLLDVAIKCVKCGEWIDNYTIRCIEDSGNHYCDECYSDVVVCCDECDYESDESDNFDDDTGLCVDCAPNKKRCVRCDEITDIADLLDGKCVDCNGLFQSCAYLDVDRYTKHVYDNLKANMGLEVSRVLNA